MIKKWIAMYRLKFGNDAARVKAIASLADSNDPDLWNVLNETINDSNTCVRSVTLRYLGEKFGVKAIDLLIPALKDKNLNIRKTAILTLGNIGDQQVVELLVESLIDESPDVSWEAALALEKISDREFIFSRLKPFVSTHSSIPAVAYLLAQYGGTELSTDLRQSVPSLVTCLQEGERNQRLAAVKALDIIGGSQAIRALLGVIYDSDERVSFVAAKALARRGDAATVQAAISKWDDSPIPWHRDEAVHTLVAARAALSSDEIKRFIEDQPGENQKNTRTQLEEQLNNLINRYAPDTFGG